jgi:hypothetical protein
VNLYVYEPETVYALVEALPAPVGQLSAAQVGLLLGLAIERHLAAAGPPARLH